MKTLWHKITYIGIHNELGPLLSKRVILTNQITLSVIIIASSYVFVFFSLSLYVLAIYTVIASISFIPILYLNKKGQYSSARVCFILLINSLVLFYSYYLGRLAGMQMVFFALASIPWVLFETYNWKYILFGLVIPIGMFYLYQFIRTPPIESISPSIIQFISLSLYGVVFLVSGLCMGFLSYQNFKSEHSLISSNQKLNGLLVELKLKNEQLESQQKLKQLNEELRQQASILQSTLELKDKINRQLERFTYMIAHDLKSPISGLSGVMGLLKHSVNNNSTSDLNETIEIMQKAFKHLTLMIDSILEHSRNNNIDQTEELVNTHELVQQIALVLFPPKNIKISIEGKLPNLVTRKFKLHQVFQNLLSNSIKFNDKSEGNILVGCSEKVDHYEFYVKDNGSGLNKDDYKRIFNLHETTNKSSTRESSTGIGLNIVKVLVEEQGGQINVESIPGQGSTFYFQWLKI